MSTMLSNELYWLVLTTLMTSLFWLPYIMNRMLEQGILKALWDPYGKTETKCRWATRMQRTARMEPGNTRIASSQRDSSD